MIKLRAILLILILLLAPMVATAKPVRVEWNKLDEATAYEVQLSRDGKVVKTQKVKDTRWIGDIDYGHYEYKVRAYDKVNRPGEWSEPKSLVAMPPKPELTFPADGKVAGLYSEKAKLTLRWKEQKGISKYAVEVRRNSRVVFRGKVKGNALDVRILKKGEYSWNVTPIIDAKGRGPAATGRKVWNGPQSSTNDFDLERRVLEKPILVYPVNQVIPPQQGKKLVLRWKPVEGADKYEVVVISAKVRGRSVAKDTIKRHKFTPDTNELAVKLPGEGVYKWQVRALANVDSKGEVGAIGPKSATKFKVDKSAEYFDGAGYLALSTMFAPYTYRVVSPLTGFEGNTDSTAATVRLSGEYWFDPKWGAGFGLENTFFTIVGQSFNRKTAELTLRTRIKFTEDKYGWYLYPKVGFEAREYFQLTPETSRDPTASTQFWTYGPSVGLDIRKQFTEKLSLGVKAAYYLPVGLIDAPEGSIISGSTSQRNYGVGIQGLYWLNKRWGLGAGGFLENRSISYRTEPTKSSTVSAPEEIFMDGNYFFMSVIYNFGF